MTPDPTPQPGPDVRAETVARVLREHRTARHVGGNGMWTVNCGCGWSTNMQPIGRDDEMHRAHQAATIIASLAVVAGDTEGIARLTEIVRVEMSKGAYQMFPDELPYESAARRVAAAVVAALDDESARLREHLALLALADSTAFPDGDVANYIARWIRDEDYPVRADGKTIRLTASDLDEEDRLVIERDAARAALDRVRALDRYDPILPPGTVSIADLRAALDPEEPR